MISKIRVLDIRDNPFLGGPSRGLFTSHKEIYSRPEVEIVNSVLAREPEGWIFRRAAVEGVKLEWIRCSGPSDLRILRNLEQFIRKNNIDVIHTRGYRGDLYVRTLLDLNWIKQPVVITKHGVQSSTNWRVRLYAWLDHRPLRMANRTIAVDTATYNLLLSWRVPKDNLTLISNPSPCFVQPDPQKLMNLRIKLGLQEPCPIVLFVARMEREKGIYDLLQAHELLRKQGKRMYLLFVGDGSCRLDMESKVALNHNKELIRFLGMQINVDEYLALSDLVVLPSYKEGMPNSLLEAMSAGKPIVATQVGGIPDLVIDGENGRLVPPGNIEGLAHAIGSQLDNPTCMREMGIKSLKMATDKFAVTKAVDALINVYKEVIKPASRPT